MRKYLTLGLFGIVAVTILAFLIKFPPYEEEQPVAINDIMSLRHVSERNDVPLDALVPLLPVEDRRDFRTTFRNVHRPLSELPIAHGDVRAAVLAARAEGVPTRDLVRFILLGIWVVAAGWILIRNRNVTRTRTIWLVITFIVFGIILGSSPNPMEAIVRVHKLINGIPGNPLVLVLGGFAIFTLLSILGARLLCSWGCPLGAVQESLYNIPVFKRFKRKHGLPFAASISIRLTVYVLFVLLLFGILNINQGGPGSILYHHLNLFKIFDPLELAVFTLILIPILLVTGLLYFRPFCHTICPFGLWAWLAERIALNKVRRVDPEACTDCGACEAACPTDAMAGINAEDGRFFLPDCWSCHRCIEACPEGVLEWGPRGIGRAREKSGRSV